MSETGLTKLGPDVSRANIFFGQVPPYTDWDAFLATLQAQPESELDGLIGFIVEELGHYEPVDEGSIHNHVIFVLQQKLRLVIRKQKGFPLVGGQKCGVCAEHPVDPVLKNYKSNYCLYCAEHELVINPYLYGGRGSCGYLLPMHDPKTTAWGLVFYHYSQDDKFLLWAAMGYKTMQEAQNALYPIKLYNDWIKRNTHGVGSVRATELIHLDLLMTNANLPLKPDEFEQVLKTRIAEHMDEDEDHMEHTIDWVLNDYDREQR